MLSIRHSSPLYCRSFFSTVPSRLFPAMAIKEELEEEVKQEGGGKDELEALDALEKEAAEYNKVCSQANQPPVTVPR